MRNIVALFLIAWRSSIFCQSSRSNVGSTISSLGQIWGDYADPHSQTERVINYKEKGLDNLLATFTRKPKNQHEKENPIGISNCAKKRITESDFTFETSSTITSKKTRDKFKEKSLGNEAFMTIPTQARIEGTIVNLNDDYDETSTSNGITTGRNCQCATMTTPSCACATSTTMTPKCACATESGTTETSLAYFKNREEHATTERLIIDDENRKSTKPLICLVKGMCEPKNAQETTSITPSTYTIGQEPIFITTLSTTGQSIKDRATNSTATIYSTLQSTTGSTIVLSSNCLESTSTTLQSTTDPENTTTSKNTTLQETTGSENKFTSTFNPTMPSTTGSVINYTITLPSNCLEITSTTVQATTGSENTTTSKNTICTSQNTTGSENHSTATFNNTIQSTTGFETNSTIALSLTSLEATSTTVQSTTDSETNLTLASSSNCLVTTSITVQSTTGSEANFTTFYPSTHSTTSSENTSTLQSTIDLENNSTATFHTIMKSPTSLETNSTIALSLCLNVTSTTMQPTTYAENTTTTTVSIATRSSTLNGTTYMYVSKVSTNTTDPPFFVLEEGPADDEVKDLLNSSCSPSMFRNHSNYSNFTSKSSLNGFETTRLPGILSTKAANFTAQTVHSSNITPYVKTENATNASILTSLMACNISDSTVNISVANYSISTTPFVIQENSTVNISTSIGANQTESTPHVFTTINMTSPLPETTNHTSSENFTSEHTYTSTVSSENYTTILSTPNANVSENLETTSLLTTPTLAGCLEITFSTTVHTFEETISTTEIIYTTCTPQAESTVEAQEAVPHSSEEAPHENGSASPEGSERSNNMNVMHAPTFLGSGESENRNSSNHNETDHNKPLTLSAVYYGQLSNGHNSKNNHSVVYSSNNNSASDIKKGSTETPTYSATYKNHSESSINSTASTHTSIKVSTTKINPSRGKLITRHIEVPDTDPPTTMSMNHSETAEVTTQSTSEAIGNTTDKRTDTTPSLENLLSSQVPNTTAAAWNSNQTNTTPQISLDNLDQSNADRLQSKMETSSTTSYPSCITSPLKTSSTFQTPTTETGTEKFAPGVPVTPIRPNVPGYNDDPSKGEHNINYPDEHLKAFNIYR